MKGNKQSKYKPCPDCGSTNVKYSKDEFEYHRPEEVECKDCGFYTHEPKLWDRIMPKEDK